MSEKAHTKVHISHTLSPPLLLSPSLPLSHTNTLSLSPSLSLSQNNQIKHILRMSEKANTKVESEEDRFKVSDVLATTAVIINDLKQRRNKNYVFSWENALHSKGDSGIKLQYTHAR